MTPSLGPSVITEVRAEPEANKGPDLQAKTTGRLGDLRWPTDPPVTSSYGTMPD